MLERLDLALILRRAGGRYRDKEGRKEAKEKGTVPWGEEVLVSKAEYEEQKSHMVDLESQVGELGKQVEMQLHLKELEAKARIEVRLTPPRSVPAARALAMFGWA